MQGKIFIWFVFSSTVLIWISEPNTFFYLFHGAIGIPFLTNSSYGASRKTRKISSICVFRSTGIKNINSFRKGTGFQFFPNLQGIGIFWLATSARTSSSKMGLAKLTWVHRFGFNTWALSILFSKIDYWWKNTFGNNSF